MAAAVADRLFFSISSASVLWHHWQSPVTRACVNTAHCSVTCGIVTCGRLVVFAGAIGALALMTVLSAAIGFALPNLLPRLYTHYAAIARRMATPLFDTTVAQSHSCRGTWYTPLDQSCRVEVRVRVLLSSVRCTSLRTSVTSC